MSAGFTSSRALAPFPTYGNNGRPAINRSGFPQEKLPNLSTSEVGDEAPCFRESRSRRYRNANCKNIREVQRMIRCCLQMRANLIQSQATPLGIAIVLAVGFDSDSASSSDAAETIVACS